MIIGLPVFASVKENPNIQIYFVNPINKSKPAKSGDGEAINALLKLINDAQEILILLFMELVMKMKFSKH